MGGRGRVEQWGYREHRPLPDHSKKTSFMNQDDEFTFGSLFSGIGGLDLGLERAGMVCKWQVENNPFCLAVLNKHWPNILKQHDITKTEARSLEPVDLICGGFPCQPFSHAGRRTAEEDHRYLWPHMLRIIRELKPTFVLAENVYGLITVKSGLVLETVYLDLEAAGYEVAPPIVFPSAAIGALHRRDRVWICAHTRHDDGSAEQRKQQEERPEEFDGIRKGINEDDPDPYISGLQRWGRTLNTERSSELTTREMDTPLSDTYIVNGNVTRHGASTVRGESRKAEISGHADWLIEPRLGRVAHGIPNRVDRLKAIGNSVVPQVAEVLGRMILSTR